jgi:hypothetical protein
MNSIFWNNNPEEIKFNLSNNIAFLGNVDIQNGKAGITGDVDLISFGPVYDFNPGFISDSDFRLADTSLCIGAGLDTLDTYPNLAAPDFDIDGNIRPDPAGSMPDLGAYESELANPLTGLTETCNHGKAVYIYPNPALDFITLSAEQDEKINSARIINSAGKEIFYRSFKAEPVKSCTIITSDPGFKGHILVEVDLGSKKVVLKAMILRTL